MRKIVVLIVLAALCATALAQQSRRRLLFPKPEASGGGGGGSTVTYDTSARCAGPTNNIETITITITVGNNANRLLIVTAGAGDNTLGDRTVDSVSSDLDGAFTLISGATADDGAFTRMEGWRLIAPTVGTHVITIDYGAAGATAQAYAFADSLYGVDQTTPVGTVTAVNGSTPSTAPTGAVTLGADDLAVGGISTDSGNPLSVTTGTQILEQEQVAADTAYGLAHNTGTGSVSITWATASQPYALVILPVNGAP